MTVFIWSGLSHLTDNYHHGGGLVVVAESLEQARELFKPPLVPAECDAFTVEPDRALPVPDDAKEEVFIFEDAGCC